MHQEQQCASELTRDVDFGSGLHRELREGQIIEASEGADICAIAEGKSHEGVAGPTWVLPHKV